MCIRDRDEQMKENPQAVAEKLQQLLEKVFVRKRMPVSYTHLDVYQRQIPIVAITCNVGVSLLGKDSFPEIDIAGITTPITKYSFIVKDVRSV